jgi:tripartite-type tricarboxylate transporter receptor subunit TctC
VDEAGVPGYDVTVWFGVLAPAGTPRDIVQRLNREMVSILHSSEVRERFAKAGVQVAASSPEEFQRFLNAEVSRWAQVVKAANIKAD